MIIRWGVFKLRTQDKYVGQGLIIQVVSCEHCETELDTPLKPIFANETGFAYCSEVCAKRNVEEVAKRMREDDPEWSGF